MAARSAPATTRNWTNCAICRQNGKQYIAQIEARERTRTGIGSLKVRFNNVFGYYIEISKANLAQCAGGLRAQADAGECRAVHHAGAEGVRAQGAIGGRKDSRDREAYLSPRCADLAAAQAQRIRATAAAVAELDVTAALAQVAAESRYVRPRFPTSGRDADRRRAGIR